MGESDDLPGEQKSSDKVEPDAKMNVCDLPMDRGLGFALHTKFYYDTNSKRCEAFTYGGAGGNGNRFNSMAECQQECGSSSDVDVCNLPMDRGLGYAYHEKFYYDTNSKQCEAFIYGGAGGNDNRFNSMAECQQECGSSSDGTDYKSLIGLWRLTYVAYIYPDIQSARTRDFTVNITSIDEVNKVFEGFLID